MTTRQATLVLLGVLALVYLAALFAAPPLVGVYHDDGIYIGTAISMAGGEGYRIPHLPANPYQAKYPPLFPALLTPVAWITGATPSHQGLSPATLAAFRWPVVLSMLGAIALLPGLYRRWGMGERAALGATALTGLSPLVLQHSFHVMSEATFFLLTVATLRLLPPADAEDGAPAPGRRWAGAAACAAGAVLCRSVGVALIPALLAAGWQRRRDWRAWTPAASTIVAFLAWSAVAGGMRSAELARELGPFYDYYIGYGSWVRTSPRLLWHVGSANLLDMWVSFGDQLTGWRVMGLPDWVWGTGAAVAGTIAMAGWRHLPAVSLPAAVYLGASLLLFLFWPFPVTRFAIPLTPFAVWGGWKTLEWACRKFQWPAKAATIVTGAAVASCVAADIARFPEPNQLPLLSSHLPAADYNNSGAWLAGNTAPEDVILSGDDPWIWLATGRKSILPGVIDPTWYYLRPTPYQERWETAWKGEFQRFEAEARRLGGKWVLWAPTWDPHLGAIWRDGLQSQPERYPQRWHTGPRNLPWVVLGVR